MAQDRAGEFEEEALDEVEPGTVFGGEGEREAARRLSTEPGLGFSGDSRVVVQDHLDRRADRVVLRSLRNSMNSRLRWRSSKAWTLPVSRSIPANRLSVPWRLYS